ncbi:hypothetical protein [Zunongwangia atlantica]|uniref:Uncharacterized protein n=1 Tax=Zunongwangia atlantica 22II14-10F7 TaxID=1185767 RepID=A0A1Y1SYR6_9FLAO|nr:hypothetical protein [Zunongwangia atlantica]ORL43712.1 hypothetical protein IIF7_19479 [Zunongwangia atlantica 22II14-10F7]
MYKYESETLYDRAFFNFTKDARQINVAFEPLGTSTYLMIIFAEDGQDLSNPHDPKFRETLNDILTNFDGGKNYTYEVAAE